LLLTACEILAVAGDPGETRALAARIAERSPGARAGYARALAEAVSGRRPEPGAVEAAAGEVARTGRIPEATRMRMCGAEILVRLPGAETEAGDLAEAAHAAYRAMGSEEWGRRAEGLLRRLGRRVPGRAGSAGPDGLTPREREVLGLIAEGLSNRGIAERLVISEATAARHVFNIFTKLGVHSRAQAVAVHLGRA
jgi:ATP/maltotriose-dependent transcriptional regulator MalT